MSRAEQDGWAALATLRDEGLHIVRQHKIGRYTVDFAAPKQRVAIEINGGVHDLPGRHEYDAQRQQHLENLGWRFIRVPARLTSNANGLLDLIRSTLIASPSRGGGRGETLHSQIQISAIAHSETANASASPHPLTPSSQEEEGFQPHLRRPASRKLKPRRKMP